MKRHYDVAIIGGAATGSSVAYFLTSNSQFKGASVAIIEKDPTFKLAATSLSSSSIRHQFSNPINVQIGQFGSRFIREFAETMRVDDDKPDLSFIENGYLFLAATDEQTQVLRDNYEVQKRCGADVVLWTADEVKAAFPHLNVENLRLASYGQSGEGWFSNTGLMNGFRKKARTQGADYIVNEVVAMNREANRITDIRLASGERIGCSFVVNATGTGATGIAAMVDLVIPIEPRKRTLFVFDCARSPQGSATVNNGQLPLMIDSSGIFCRPEGTCFLAGTTPNPDPAVDLDDFDPRHDEFETIWMGLATRSKNFEAIKLINYWAGHYDYNTLDQNAIVGPHTEVRNFIFANGFSGHGLQQSPAIGRGIAEWIIHGEFKTLDLSLLGYERVASGSPFVEKAVI